MCSILGILDIVGDPRQLRELALRLSRRQRHRGPDWSGVYSGERAVLAHEWLAIVGVDTGAQPLYNPERTHVLAVNGELYNHQDLERQLGQPFTFQTHSDGRPGGSRRGYRSSTASSSTSPWASTPRRRGSSAGG